MQKWVDGAFIVACAVYAFAIVSVLGTYPQPCGAAARYCGIARFFFDFQTLIAGLMAVVAGLFVIARHCSK
jgi:hypothetical protein